MESPFIGAGRSLLAATLKQLSEDRRQSSATGRIDAASLAASPLLLLPLG